MFWLNGLAGTGKSTIAQTFAETSFADGKLGASFFCSRDFVDRSNLRTIFRTLAYQLAYRYPTFRAKLLQVLKANPDAGHESLCSQMERLIVDPLKAANISTLIIIDALDECKDEEPASALLSVLSHYANEIPNAKFFLTGRPEARIRTGFRLKPLIPITEVLKLHEVKPEIVDSDIKLFFQTRLSKLVEGRSDCGSMGDWPSPSDVRILCRKAAGFFIYAAIVVKFVDSDIDLPSERLSLITSLPQSTVEEGRSGIDQLYIKVLEQGFSAVHSQAHLRFQTIVGTILLIFNPLPIKALSELLGIPNVQTTIRSLHSLLLIPDKPEDPIRTFHKSFPDFLTDPERCTDSRFLVEPGVHHMEILLLCTTLMREKLKKNICNLDDHAMLKTVEDLAARRRAHIGSTLEYACRFWTKHLLAVPINSHVKEVQKAVDTFFTTCLLHWIEVLALTGHLGVGVYAMNDVEQWYTLVSTSVVIQWHQYSYFFQAGLSCQWTVDSQRFILEYFDMINDSPSVVNSYGLIFSPPSSWIHQYYSSELMHEVRVIKGISGWGECFRIVQLEGILFSFVCRKDAIAVTSSEDNNITILDTITGSQMAHYSGHTDKVFALVFSSDETSLVSGSYDKTIKLWDIQTGGVIKTLYGHTAAVLSVSISANYVTIASGSIDQTVRLWDIETGECHCTISQMGSVNQVQFFPSNPKHLISVAGSKVWQWNTDGKPIGPTHDGFYATFSLNGDKLALSHEEIIQVKNPSSGEIVAQLSTSTPKVENCCFSPDGRLFAIASGSTVHIWDIASPTPSVVETFIDHTDVESLGFSSPKSLISMYTFGFFKFWQVGISSIFTDTSTFAIQSITLRAKDGITISSDSDGVARIWDLSTGLCNKTFQIPAKGTCMRDIQLVENRWILVWYMDTKFHIWAIEKGELLQTVDRVENDIQELRISGDGSKVFYTSGSFMKALHLQTGEIVGEMELNQPRSSKPLLVVNGSRVWVNNSSQIQGWDFEIQDSPSSKPHEIPPTRFHLDFIGGVRRHRSALPAIEDTITGREFLRLPESLSYPTDAQWDGQYLVAGYETGDMLILNCNCPLSH